MVVGVGHGGWVMGMVGGGYGTTVQYGGQKLNKTVLLSDRDRRVASIFAAISAI